MRSSTGQRVNGLSQSWRPAAGCEGSPLPVCETAARAARGGFAADYLTVTGARFTRDVYSECGGFHYDRMDAAFTD